MRIAVVLIVVLCCASCSPTSPSQSLSGFWIARSIGHSAQVGFTLMQSGDMITGKACAISDGVLLYKDAPVSGEYPNVQFTVAPQQTQPCCANIAGMHFSGKQDGTKDIVGTYGTIDLRFERSLTSLCN
jgi:hypothetical protein